MPLNSFAPLSSRVTNAPVLVLFQEGVRQKRRSPKAYARALALHMMFRLHFAPEGLAEGCRGYLSSVYGDEDLVNSTVFFCQWKHV